MTDEPAETLILEPGTLTHWEVADFAVLGLCHPGDDGGYLGAALLVAVGSEEQQVEVDVGETFPVGEQMWRLDSIRDEDDYGATISRVS